MHSDTTKSHWLGLTLTLAALSPAVSAQTLIGINERATLADAGVLAGDDFGSSLEVSGDVALLGARWDDTNGLNAGAAYVFRARNELYNDWALEAKLLAPDGQALDFYGQSVGVSGDTIVVGAPQSIVALQGATAGPDRNGLAYVYKHDGLNWNLIKQLSAPDTSFEYGWSVAIDGNFIAIGAWASGKVYVYSRNLGGTDNWGLRHEVDGSATAWFGWSVDISSTRFIVGAPFALNQLEQQRGRAYVFGVGTADFRGFLEFNNTTGFGNVVALDGSTAAVSDGLFESDGEVYVFDSQAGAAPAQADDNWGWVQTVVPDDLAGAGFGQKLDLDGGRLVVGVSLDQEAGPSAGAVYLFDENQNGPDQWGQVEKLFATQPADFARFGLGVATSGSSLLVSSRGPSPQATFYGLVTDTDSDGDGHADAADNCTTTFNRWQRDTDGDGFGNTCDADLDNSCAVNFVDLGLMRDAFFKGGPDLVEDLNGDGLVNFLDLGLMKSLFFAPPGPTGVPNDCD